MQHLRKMIICLSLILTFSLCGCGGKSCGGNSTDIYGPVNQIEVQFSSSSYSESDTITVTVAIGLQDDEVEYEYKLYVYNRKDSTSKEKWHVLKDIGKYSKTYDYIWEEDEINFLYSAEFEVPRELIIGNVGSICFALDGTYYVGELFSDGITQSVEFEYVQQKELMFTKSK